MRLADKQKKLKAYPPPLLFSLQSLPVSSQGPLLWVWYTAWNGTTLTLSPATFVSTFPRRISVSFNPLFLGPDISPIKAVLICLVPFRSPSHSRCSKLHQWVRSHASLSGNVLTDLLAKSGEVLSH